MGRSANYYPFRCFLFELEVFWSRARSISDHHEPPPLVLGVVRTARVRRRFTVRRCLATHSRRARRTRCTRVDNRRARAHVERMSPVRFGRFPYTAFVWDAHETLWPIVRPRGDKMSIRPGVANEPRARGCRNNGR